MTLKINVYNIYVLPMTTYGFETMDVVEASACNYNNHSALWRNRVLGISFRDRISLTEKNAGGSAPKQNWKNMEEAYNQQQMTNDLEE